MTEPDFMPRPDGVAAAISAGRRRRSQRQLGGAGAAAALAAFAVLVANPFSTGGASDSLSVAADPSISADGTPDPGPGEASADPSAEPTQEPSEAPSANGGDPNATTAPAPGDPGQPGDPTGASDPGSVPDASAGPDAPERVSPPPTESVVPYGAGEDCATQSVPLQNPPAWCTRYSGDTTVARGGEARISVDLCRPTGAGSAEVTFADEDGITMAVDGSGATEWTSRDGRTVAKTRDTETVADGTCLRWTSMWDTRDRDGFRVRPGDYTISYSIEGDAGWSGSYGTLTVR